MSTQDDLRERIVAEARTWVGTPFVHQAAVKGVGVDCVMLLHEVGVACGVMQSDDAKWIAYRGYSRQPNPRMMREALEKFLTRIEIADALDGDIVWLFWRESMPMHLALRSSYNGRKNIIHALASAERVVEHEFSSDWRARVDSVWRYPGVV
jgi:NlpC/P60 family putative phage cell wall peptidase